MEEKFLGEVDKGKEFYLKNGKIIRSLEELAREIKEIDKGTFLRHVNEERNDFENWVRDVVGDFVLANRIREINKPFSMSKIISARVARLTLL